MIDEVKASEINGESQGSCPLDRVHLRQVRYGLPCALCRAYYPSTLRACPVCKCNERISPVVVRDPVKVL